MASLILNHGGTQPVTHELVGDLITIGRDPSNNVVIDDPTVSARHASITKSSTGYGLTDLGSTNGTWINGVSITDAEVKDGDEIRFGSVTAVFRDGRRSDETETFKASLEHPPPALADASSRWSFSRKSATVAVVALIAISICTWSVIVRHQTDRPTAATQTFDLVTLAKKTRNAVVLIDVFDNDRKEIATGSGFFVSANGLLVTNAHVIKRAASAVAKTESGALLPIKGGISVDWENDLALLVVETARMPFLAVGRSNSAEAGNHIAVIGSPLGLEGSLSEGIVSAKRKDAAGRLQWLQITAPISPGSSGSPVLNLNGEVIGVATILIRESQALNFAVPSEAVSALVKKAEGQNTLLSFESIQRENELFDKDASSKQSVAQTLAEGETYEEAMTSPEMKAVRDSWRNAGMTQDWSGALEAARMLVAKYPACPNAYERLGEAWQNTGFLEDAVLAYQRAVQLFVSAGFLPYGSEADAWQSLGFLFKEQRKTPQATSAFSRAIDAYQQQLKNASFLATLPGRKDESLTDAASILVNLGKCCVGLGDREAARKIFQEVTQDSAAPWFFTFEAWKALGELYAQERDERNALAAFRNISKTAGDAWGWLADYYDKNGLTDDSIRARNESDKLILSGH
jgi:S1-C subfamily serine protease